MAIKFIITGNPISSKNSIRSGITKSGRNYTYTKKPIKDYRDSALKQLKEQSKVGFFIYIKTIDEMNMEHEYLDLPIQKPVQASFHFYCIDNRKRDLINLIQCPADLLQEAKIIENDCLIISLDNSRIVGVDAENPRTEITINIIGDK